ncbi:MAG: hypothetical protein HGB17_00395 [Syntrophobacteraceae bacterium]|nr:hypothetical protein [Syntrophobacteraceae bacterium]
MRRTLIFVAALGCLLGGAASQAAAKELQVGNAAPVWQPYEAMVDLGPGSEDTAVLLRLQDAAGNISSAFAATAGYQVALPMINR